MKSLFQISHEPKMLEIEKTDDGRFRLVITLRKLNQTSKLDYFLNASEAKVLSQVFNT